MKTQRDPSWTREELLLAFNLYLYISSQRGCLNFKKIFLTKCEICVAKKNQHEVGILNKDTIETWVLPHLTVGERGFEPTVPLTEIVEAILHRMKTDFQWRELPTKQFFSKKMLRWNSVYHHFNKWSRRPRQKVVVGEKYG